MILRISAVVLDPAAWCLKPCMDDTNYHSILKVCIMILQVCWNIKKSSFNLWYPRWNPIVIVQGDAMLVRAFTFHCNPQSPCNPQYRKRSPIVISTVRCSKRTSLLSRIHPVQSIQSLIAFEQSKQFRTYQDSAGT